jgi:hypothetical protein
MHLLRPYGATLTSTLFSAAWPGLSTSPSARPPRTDPPFVPSEVPVVLADRVPPRVMTPPHSRTGHGAQLTSRGAPGRMACASLIENLGGL